MKSTVLFPLLFASFAAATFRSISKEQWILADNRDVPGENPLQFCQTADDYLLTIDHVNVSPNPPVEGKTLIIEAKGNFTAEVIKGAYIHLSVKYSLITLIKQTVDLCEQIHNVDKECPLYGEKALTKKFELPSPIPPGKYTVLADVYTHDDRQITCLEATVKI